MSTNPLRDGMRMSRVPGPGALVIFGASGDLAHRKLLPALYNLALRNMLPPTFALIGVARKDYGGDAGYRKEVRKALGASGVRLATTLIHHLTRTGGRFGLQTMCEAGGMANASIIELLSR